MANVGRVTLLGTQGPAAETTGAATNISGATTVQCYQYGTSPRIITVQNADGTNLRTIQLPAANGSIYYIEKGADEEMWAASTDVLFTPVLYHES
jgi:hypothetical protein